MFIPGAVALWGAFFALTASTIFYLRSLRGDAEARAWARQTYALATTAAVVATGVLLFLILTHDFRIHYVYSYSDLSLPTPYLVSTLWAGQEGSFLLWLLWGLVVGLPLIRYAHHYEDRTMIVYNLAQISLLLILLRQSPFRFLAELAPGQAPSDGQGLNPLLQNPWMTIHPPIMFLGYAASAVPFAFAVAALWERRYDEWTKASLPWALLTVVTLGCAILLGGYWAYVTLGWGGYWGWDPVENSSLVPWIASSALVHGMLLQRARGRFRKLNLSLAILAYVLVVYATFLTRSGVLADFSVHSFVDLGITGWLVGNLAGAVLIGFGSLAWRWREIPRESGDEPFLSRTVFFVLAIAALLGTAAMILLGTSAPLITRFAAKPSQVGPAFYNRVLLPVGIFLACLLGVVPYLNWRGATAEFRRRTLIVAAVAVVATAGALGLGAHGTLYLAFLFVSLFAFLSNLLKTADELRARRVRAAGGYLAHVGLGLMLAGIMTSSGYDRTAKVVLPLGEGKQVLGYTLTFRGVEKAKPGARDAMLVEVREANGRSYVARPLLFRNEKTNQLVANPDVRVHLTHDVYISPIEFDPGTAADSAQTLEIAKGETKPFGPLSVTFQGFDMSGSHGDGQRISIGARINVHDAGRSVELVPKISTSTQGFVSDPMPLAGRPGVAVQLTAIDASGGRVRLAFPGLGGGVAKRAVLHKGEALTYRDVRLRFDEFDLSDFDPKAGKINIAAVFTASPNGGAGTRIIARYRGGEAGETYEDAQVPGLAGVALRLGKMNADDKSVEAEVLDAQAAVPPGEPMRFSVDVTVKPLIGLLWTGLIVLLAGGILAMVRRSREFTTTLTRQP
jgi:cytochrome c-type biogenesis protein CcmF